MLSVDKSQLSSVALTVRVAENPSANSAVKLRVRRKIAIFMYFHSIGYFVRFFSGNKGGFLVTAVPHK